LSNLPYPSRLKGGGVLMKNKEPHFVKVNSSLAKKKREKWSTID
jgi:hypothetical protein